MNDLVSDHGAVVLPVAALLSAVAAAGSSILAWRHRRRRARVIAGAVVAIALLFWSARLLQTWRANGFVYELQARTGEDVSAYAFWTVADATRHTLAEFRGRPVLVYSWATTCGPCRPTLPFLAQLDSDLAGRAAIVLLSHEGREVLLRHASTRGIPGVAAYAPEPLIPRGRTWTFPLAPAPTTFLLDRRGTVRRVMVGRRSGEHLRARLEEILAEPR